MGDIDDDDGDREAVVFPVEAVRLSFSGRFDFVITDPGLLQAEAVRLYTQGRPELPADDIAEHTAEPEAALHTVLVERLLAPLPGAAQAGARWALDDVAMTLWEESDSAAD